MAHLLEPIYCLDCDGINLIWDKEHEQWTAPYIDGALYCECPDELLDKLIEIV